MFAAVRAAFVEHELMIVFREGQRVGHHLIGENPVAVDVIEVVLAVLEEDAKRFGWRFAQEKRIVVAATDVREAADMAEDFAEEIRSFPCRRKGAYPAAADPADGALLRGSAVNGCFFATSGKISVSRNFT